MEWCKNAGYELDCVYLARMKVKSCYCCDLAEDIGQRNSIKVRIDAKRNSCHDAQRSMDVSVYLKVVSPPNMNKSGF